MNDRKEILIAVVGETPQIITETLYYYLSPYYKSIRKFDKIIVLTTSKGKKVIIKHLIKGKILEEMFEKLGDSVKFSEEDILVFKDGDGKEMADVRNTEQNLDSFNEVFKQMRTLANISNSRITALCSGGRKTMTGIMSLSFQMFGRNDDELIHIIAPNSKMSYDLDVPMQDRWFYPENPTDPSERLDLSVIPVLKIGKSLPYDMLKKMENRSYSEVLEAVQSYILDKAPVGEITIVKNMFFYKNEKIELPARLASYLRLFIKARRSGTEDSSKGYLSYQDIVEQRPYKILKEYGAIKGINSTSYLNEKSKSFSFANRSDYDEVREHISRLRKQIRNSKVSDRFISSVQICDELREAENGKKIRYFGVQKKIKKVKFKD